MKTAFTFFALVFFVFSIKSQETQTKYEFLIIKYCAEGERLFLSVNGQDYLRLKVEVSDKDKSKFNANPLLKAVGEYQDKDWELISFNNVIIGMGAKGEDYDIAYMRRKKK